MFYEIGPIHIDEKGSLYDNTQYAWNRNANILFLESPICVGFSHADDETNSYTAHCNMNDTTTADDNYHVILKFLEKFPVYKDSDFFVMGESYGCVYVPALTQRILQGNADQDNEHNPQINIIGIAAGNGVLPANYRHNAERWYQYHHGMISEKVWNDMLNNCCVAPYDRRSCNFDNSTDENCVSAIQTAQNNCCKDINGYNILDPC